MRHVEAAKGFRIPQIALGCMRISELSQKELAVLVDTALENGIDFFDHANIYGGGKCEEMFGQLLQERQGLRKKVQLLSKCGITQGHYDFSKEHILKSVEGSLKRLQTDHLDVLLLHRPDALMEPEEVAQALDQLHAEGKVLHFGVSNHHPRQLDLLKKYVKQPLIFNQLQLSLMFTGMIDQGVNVNMMVDGSVDRDGGILDYCRLNDMVIQAWSPFQHGFFGGAFVGSKKFPELNKALDAMAEKYKVSQSAIAAAWILRHPAKMQVVLGTTKSQRVEAIAKATSITLSRPDWYALYFAAGNEVP